MQVPKVFSGYPRDEQDKVVVTTTSSFFSGKITKVGGRKESYSSIGQGQNREQGREKKNSKKKAEAMKYPIQSLL